MVSRRRRDPIPMNPVPVAEVAPKIANAAAHFRVLAKRMEGLHAEVVELERVAEAERRNFDDEMSAKDAELAHMEETCRDIDGFIESIRDVQRGVRTLDEVMEEVNREWE